jgi:hypothetical protein
MPLAQLAQLAALSAGFQLAVWRFARACPAGGLGLRFVLGLAGGGLFAHLGWAVLHADRVALHPQLLLDLRSGYTLLTAPLGAAVAAYGLPVAERARYLAAGARALPLGLASAKAGCVAVGCCGPTALAEAALFLALDALCGRVEPRRVPALFCLGLGALRLAVEPFRPVPSFAPPVVPPALLCAGWLAGGLALIARSTGPASGERHAEVFPTPGFVGAGERPHGGR